MAQTVDEIVRDMMVSTLSAVLCSHGSNGSTPTELTDADVVDVIMGLRQGNARMMAPQKMGENKFGSAPIRESYWGFMSVDLQDDLEDLDTFVPVSDYPNSGGVLDSEWGATKNIRWLQSTNGYSSGGTYSNFVVGQESYGVVKLGGHGSQMIMKPLGSAGTADPLDQRASAGWKMQYACRVLNDNWIAQLTCTHS